MKVLRSSTLDPCFKPWSAPFLRWAGSKRKLLPDIVSRIPQYSRYIEPFAGSACVFFAIRPKRAILGDCNSDLLKTYATVRKHPWRVYEAAVRWPRTESFYYRLRDHTEFIADPINEAARFLYLNRYCFNGVFRTNRTGRFNVPRGTGMGRFPSASLLYRCSVALRNADLLTSDFEACVAKARAGDFVYLDPPYAKDDARFRGEYGYSSFAALDIERLLRCIKCLDDRGVKFMLSYSFCREIRPALETWHTRHILVRRHVAGFEHHRARVKEVLITNYPIN